MLLDSNKKVHWSYNHFSLHIDPIHVSTSCDSKSLKVANQSPFILEVAAVGC